jgi:uncharacterized protein
LKIGILSDTHGQVDLAMAAAREFMFRGIDAVLHCGDIGSDMVLTEMAAMFNALDIPLYAVYGNCDRHDEYSHFPGNIGVRLLGRFGELELAGRKIALLHSDDQDIFHETVRSNRYDYVFFGHSHTRRDSRKNRTRLINPGSAGRGMHPSCAVLNLDTDQLTFVTIPRAE